MSNVETITLTRDDLRNLLHEYDEDEYEAKPLNVESFIEHAFLLHNEDYFKRAAKQAAFEERDCWE